VLIARLSTAAGLRSPLGHIADEVFSGLVSELNQQGVSNKVIADMFGMALRSYRQKVQRLGESASSRADTLWSAVQAFLAEREWSTRSEVLQRFQREDETSVRAILNDLVESGLAVRSGVREDTRFRAATDEELRELGTGPGTGDQDILTGLVWLQIYHEGPMTVPQLAQRLPFTHSELALALGTLTSDGRVSRHLIASDEVFAAEEVSRPIGEAAGWEAAIVDHHRAVLNAIAARVSGSHSSEPNDEVDGRTLRFDLWPGHPKEREVRRLLAETRAAASLLWEEVNEWSKNVSCSRAYQVHFYFGQYVVADDDSS
jgi:predicted transcriptional regulator